MSLADLSLFSMERPASLRSLCQTLAARHADGKATVLYAGGTDWMVEQEMRPPMAPGEEPPLVLDIGRLAELRGVSMIGRTLRIGAAATYLELQRSPAVRLHAPLIERMGRDVGAVQIQARGTLGGNLATASPAADGVAALAAYDATIVVESARGSRRIAMGDLQTGYKKSTRAPDEVIVAIEIALPEKGAPWLWRKVGARRAQAISKVALAGVAEVKDGWAVRFGLGMASVAPVTAHLWNTRALVQSMPLRELSADEIEAAVASDISPIDDVRSTGEYRLHCAKSVVLQFLRQLGARL
ncbi:MAG: FAD binding domain-containing protein [Byssovorax sp.]